MKWSMDTHKYMSEITRKALQIMVKHGVTSESEPEQIDLVERELAAAGIYKNYESAKGRIRRALFTYFKAYGCMESNENLTEIGKAFVDNKLSIKEFSFYYVSNYVYSDDDHSYYPLQLILTCIRKMHDISVSEAYLTAYDFSRIVECNDVSDITNDFITELLSARTGEPIEVNERSIGFDVWAKMLVQAGIFIRNDDKNLIVSNYDMVNWIISAYEKGISTEMGLHCTGILKSIPIIQVGSMHGDVSCFSNEGKSLQAFLFDSVDDSIVEKYIYECKEHIYSEMLDMLGLDKIKKGFYKVFSGLERLVGFSLIENEDIKIKTIGEIILSLPVIAEEFDEESEDSELDEYQRAAQILKDYCVNNEVVVTARSDIDVAREDFIERFGPEKLAALSDQDLLQNMFYCKGDNKDSLCCWIEMNKECRSCFGSISGGSAYKFGLFQRQDDGRWQTGSANKPIDLSLEEALMRGKAIRDALVKGCDIIQNAKTETLEDYEQLDANLKNGISSEYTYYNWAWFHKYFSILYPEKLSSYHNREWQYHILRCYYYFIVYAIVLKNLCCSLILI